MVFENNKKSSARKSMDSNDVSFSGVQSDKMVAIDHFIEKFVYLEYLINFIKDALNYE